MGKNESNYKLYITVLITAIALLWSFSPPALSYPPRDHNTWCYFCKGDGFIDYGDPPTIFFPRFPNGEGTWVPSKAADAYIRTYYSNWNLGMPIRPQSVADQGIPFPSTDSSFITTRYPCRFDLCGSNSLGSNYIKYNKSAVVGPVKCYDCHSLNKAVIARKTRAVNKLIVKEDTACDWCHNVKSFEGGKIDYDSMTYWSRQNASQAQKDILKRENVVHPYSASAHPFPAGNTTYIAGQAGDYRKPRKMVCGDCHDTKQVTLPNDIIGKLFHEKYSTRFRLRGGAEGPDIDGQTDTARIGTLWEWMQRRENGLDTTRSSAPIGTLADDSSLASSFMTFRFKRGDGRVKAFYSNDFCLQCHDKGGKFGGGGLSDTSLRSPYYAPDIRFSWYGSNRNGHIIRQKGKYLKPGDKMPCTFCHDPHSSENNLFMLKDLISQNGIVEGGNPLISRAFCRRCHINPYKRDGELNPSINLQSTYIYSWDTSYNIYDSVMIYGIGGIDIDPILEGVVIPISPKTVDKILKKKYYLDTNPDPRNTAEAHTNRDNTQNCVSKWDFNRNTYYIPENNGSPNNITPITQRDLSPPPPGKDIHDGCHSSAHAPAVLSCDGCHKEEFDWAFYSNSKEGAGKPKYTRKSFIKPGLWINFTRHPVNVNLYTKFGNAQVIDQGGQGIEVDVDAEVKNWLFNPDIQKALKEFFMDPNNDGDKSDKITPFFDTSYTAWETTWLGKSYRGPEMDQTGSGIICLSCHNDHYIRNKYIEPWKTQAFLRMDMPYICLTCHPKGIVYDEATKKIRASYNRHGGFLPGDGNSTVKCNSCHSMHGRHPVDSTDRYSYVYNSTGDYRAIELRYKMYKSEMDMTLEELYVDRFGNYQTTASLADTTFDGQRIYKDISGTFYSKNKVLIYGDKARSQPYAHLMHNRNQIITCGRCHGLDPAVNLRRALGNPDTSLITNPNFRWPSNILYPAAGDPKNYPHTGNFGRDDTYFTTGLWRDDVQNNFKNVRRSYKGGTEHDIDLTDDQNDAYDTIPSSGGYSLHLRCGYCHDPHGNDNYVQLRNKIPIAYSASAEDTTLWKWNGNVESPGADNYTYTPDGKPLIVVKGDNKYSVTPGNFRSYYYTTGIVDFCTSCHIRLDDQSIEWYRSPSNFDTRRMETVFIDGIGNRIIGKSFARHPTNISMRTLINRVTYTKGDTTKIFEELDKQWDSIVLQKKCAAENKRTDPIIGEVTCLTCHNAHASPNTSGRLRKSYDFGINSCVRICHPYIKLNNKGAY